MKHQKFNCDVERVTPLEGNDLQTVVTFSRPPVCPLLVKMASIICFRHFSLSLSPTASSPLLLLLPPPPHWRACVFVCIHMRNTISRAEISKKRIQWRNVRRVNKKKDGKHRKMEKKNNGEREKQWERTQPRVYLQSRYINLIEMNHIARPRQRREIKPGTGRWPLNLERKSIHASWRFDIETIAKLNIELTDLCFFEVD